MKNNNEWNLIYTEENGNDADDYTERENKRGRLYTSSPPQIFSETAPGEANDTLKPRKRPRFSVSAFGSPLYVSEQFRVHVNTKYFCIRIYIFELIITLFAWSHVESNFKRCYFICSLVLIIICIFFLPRKTKSCWQVQ